MNKKSKTTMGCVQPSYFAWVPFFQRMIESDVFIFLDDVKFSKNSSHNRNKIKTQSGEIYLTAPVLYKGNSESKIMDIRLLSENNWIEKHKKTIIHTYKKAPFYEEVMQILESEIFNYKWRFLGELNIKIIMLFKDYFNISTECHLSSDCNIDSTENKKLVDLCAKFGASEFLVKPGTEHYHPESEFLPYGVNFRYFSPERIIYKHIHGGEASNLSVLDFAMHLGSDGFKKLYA